MPPLAVRVVDAPLQMVAPEPVLMVGTAFTDTVTVAVLLQPLVVMPVTI